MIEKDIPQYAFFEFDREICSPIILPKCCWLGGLQADHPTCMQCEKNGLAGKSEQFQICREMNLNIGYKASGLSPEEVQKVAEKMEES